MFVAVALFVLVSLASVSEGYAVPVDALSVRMANHSAHTRFVVDLSEKIPFSITTSNINNVIINLKNVIWKIPHLSGTGTGVISGYRYHKDSVTSHIIIELMRPVSVANAFLLAPDQKKSWRLVVDFSEGSESEENDQRLRGGSCVAEPIGRNGSSDSHQKNVVPLPPLQPDFFKKEYKPLIVLDPGHGGADPGTTGYSGIFEKNITLSMAFELREKLLRTHKYRVFLTREDDTFVALRKRVESARAHNADLFISIHADAIATPAICGLSVYTLSEEASDQEAASLAERENRADLIGGVDLSRESRDVANILIDLVQRETMNHSAQLARAFTHELRQEIRLLPKTHRSAGFAVLKAPDVPAILLEMGYLSNPKEEQLLHQPAYRAKLSAAMVRAIDYYFKRRQVSPL